MNFLSIFDDEAYGFAIYWKIENFKCEQKKNTTFGSLMFKIKALKSKWKIEIREEEKCLSAYIFKVTNPESTNVNFSVSILTGLGWYVIHERLAINLIGGGNGDGAKKFLSLENLKLKERFYLLNGALQIKFRLRENGVRNAPTQYIMISWLAKNNELQHAPIKTFFNTNPNELISLQPSLEFHGSGYQPFHTTKDDVDDEEELLNPLMVKRLVFATLRTSSKEFTVYKAVLCAKSPVFNAMFERKRMRKDCNLLDIHDIDNKTVASLIKFLHNGPLDDLEFANIAKLYYAADKYQIDPLKRICVSFLRKGLTVKNICEAFVLADKHNDRNLMKHAQNYFCNHSKVIMKSEDWKNFILTHTKLIPEILSKLSEKM